MAHQWSLGYVNGTLIPKNVTLFVLEMETFGKSDKKCRAVARIASFRDLYVDVEGGCTNDVIAVRTAVTGEGC